MFLGEFHHTIDDKGRLTLPAKYRGDLAQGVVAIRGLDRCLYVYAKGEWEKLAGKLAELPLTRRQARLFKRYICAGADDSQPDKQGRILLPSSLRQYAGLDGDVVILGAIDHLEVWNADTWTQTIADIELNAEQTAEQLAELVQL